MEIEQELRGRRQLELGRGRGLGLGRTGVSMQAQVRLLKSERVARRLSAGAQAERALERARKSSAVGCK